MSMAFIPTGLIQLVTPAAFIPRARVMPPTSFDASALQLDQRLNENPQFGYYPVELGGDWSSRLAFKMFRPFVEDPFGEIDIQAGGQGCVSPEDETYWYTWLDRQGIGLAIYGTYQFRFEHDSTLYRGLLTEFIGGDPVLLASNITDFSKDSDSARLICARWNNRSRADWQRINQVLTENRISAGDLQLLLSDNGRITVIDPELFSILAYTAEPEPIESWGRFDSSFENWDEPRDQDQMDEEEMSLSFGFGPGVIADPPMKMLERSLYRLVDIR